MALRSACFTFSITVVASLQVNAAWAQATNCTNHPAAEDHTALERTIEGVLAAGTLAIVLTGRGGKVVQLMASSGLTTSSFALGKSFFGQAEAQGTTVCVIDGPFGFGGLQERKVVVGPPGGTERVAEQLLREPVRTPDWMKEALGQGNAVNFRIGSDQSLKFVQPTDRIRPFDRILQGGPIK